MPVKSDRWCWYSQWPSGWIGRKMWTGCQCTLTNTKTSNTSCVISLFWGILEKLAHHQGKWLFWAACNCMMDKLFWNPALNTGCYSKSPKQFQYNFHSTCTSCFHFRSPKCKCLILIWLLSMTILHVAKMTTAGGASDKNFSISVFHLCHWLTLWMSVHCVLITLFCSLTHCGLVVSHGLMAPSHYLNQCWLIISEVQWQSLYGNFTSTINYHFKITYQNFPSNLLGPLFLTWFNFNPSMDK